MIVYIHQSKLREQERKDMMASIWFGVGCLCLVGVTLYFALRGV